MVAEADQTQTMELTMHELRLIGGVCGPLSQSAQCSVSRCEAPAPRAPTARSD